MLAMAWTTASTQHDIIHFAQIIMTEPIITSPQMDDQNQTYEIFFSSFFLFRHEKFFTLVEKMKGKKISPWNDNERASESRDLMICRCLIKKKYFLFFLFYLAEVFFSFFNFIFFLGGWWWDWPAGRNKDWGDVLEFD